MTPFQNPAVAKVFEAYPPAVRKKALALRTLIFRYDDEVLELKFP